MNYNLILEEIDEIYKIIKINEKILENLKEEEITLFKKSFNKNLTIEIYTFWENFCKELIYNCYLNYKKIIIDKEFLINYFEHVQEKSFVRKLFLKSINDNKIDIKIETLCSSNNLNFKELNELFQRVRFSKDDFLKHVDGFKDLENSIAKLKEKGIYPEASEVQSLPTNIEYLELYLNLIVKNRNKVAHQYNIDEVYSLEQFECILEFIKAITFIVFEFCISQLMKKSKNREEIISKRIFPMCVIRSNSNGRNAIIGIRNNTKEIINKDTQLYFFDKGKNIYRMAKIVKIVKNKRECSEILPIQSYSIEIDTNSPVRTENKRFEIHKMDAKYMQFDYQVIV